jgi:hypothetical protein
MQNSLIKYAKQFYLSMAVINKKNKPYNNHKKYIKKRRKYSCHERKGYKFKDFTWKP